MLMKETILRTNKEGKEFKSEFIFGVGNLTADINTRIVTAQGEEKHVTDGRSSVAFNVLEKGKEKAYFYQIEAWEKVAEILAQYGSKGRRIAIAGRTKQSEYETKEGETRTIDVVVVERFKFLDFKENDKVVEESTEENIGGQEDYDFYSDEDLPF